MSLLRVALLLLGVTVVICADNSDKPPQVYVYTRDPIKYGEPNELICHCKNFHPPVISLQLKKNGEEYKDCRETDMTFGQDWTYYITKHIKFTPQDGVEYSCVVQHNNGPVKSYVLDPLM